MKIAILKEDGAGERRVAGTPETVKKFIGLGAVVVVESGAGAGSSLSDATYAEAGATLGSRAEALADADILLTVQGVSPASLAGAKPGAWLVGNLNPFGERDRVAAYATAGLEALAMEFMPRITRAQSMDTLSSQSNLAGYKAVLDAAGEYGRAFPMMMTAAGTITAARVFVMGVGVAGLQAIATARRLGAQVSATDVRSATKEQIESLGAQGVFVDQVPGSVIVDLAIEQGGNVEGAVLGEVVERHGVKIVGHRNVASRLATDASALFSRNLFNFLSAFWDKEAGRLVLPDEDEITKAIRLTQGGKVVSERLLPQPATA